MEKILVMTRVFGSSSVGRALDLILHFDQEGIDVDHFIFATKENDPLIGAISDNRVEIIISDLSRFDDPVNNLLDRASDFRIPGLFISPGVLISRQHVESALSELSSGAMIVSWQIENQGNDGSRIGKLFYNTCALYSPDALDVVKNSIPDVVNNGVLGNISLIFDEMLQDVPIGGNEEIFELHALMKKHPDQKPLVIHHLECLSMGAKTATNISYDIKILRKVPVSLIYARYLGVPERKFMEFVEIRF